VEEASLDKVSCVSTSDRIAVGGYATYILIYKGTQAVLPLAEQRNGQSLGNPDVRRRVDRGQTG
jgi:hypothetical protein